MARATVGCVVAATVLAFAGCGGADTVKSAPQSPAARRTETSPAFAANGTIPVRYTCSGSGDRPALHFGGVPSGARELALLVIDPDAGGFDHWTVYALAPGTRAIAATGRGELVGRYGNS